MTDDLCPFARSDLASSCFILRHRNVLGVTTPCSMSPICHTAKHILRENADESLSLTKNALIYDIPTAVLSHPLLEKYSFIAAGEHNLDECMADLTKLNKEELQRQLAEANRLVADAFSSMADLIRLNIAATAKNMEDTNKALNELISASDANALASAFSAHQENTQEQIRSYNTRLASVATKARERINQSSNRQMSELIKRLEKLSQNIQPQQSTGNEYLEQFSANLSNSMNSYLEFTKKSQAFFDDYQNAWLATLQLGQVPEKQEGKVSAKKKK